MYQQYFTQGLKTVVFSICVAVTLLFPPAILADNAKLELASGSLHLPLVEVVFPNGEVVCYQADLELMSDSNPMAFSLIGGAPVDCGCQNPGTPSYNECQTRRLQGTWSFTYTDGNTSTTRFYALTDVREDSDSPGEYLIIGSNEEGESIIGSYDAEIDIFYLMDPISNTDNRFFSFDFVSEDTVAGCLFLFIGDNISDCHNMTGTRTSDRHRAAKRVPIVDAVQGLYEKSKHLRMEMIDQMK